MNGTFSHTAFEELFRKEYKSLCLLAVSFLKDMEASEEIVQDCFVNLWERREQMDAEKNIRSYLVTMVRNRSLNYLRDHKKFNRNLLGFEGLLADESVSMTDPIQVHELRMRISAAVDELPEKCREVFHLSRNENLKYQEIADRLAISVKTVETQISKALQHLRIRLAEYLTLLLLCALAFLR